MLNRVTLQGRLTHDPELKTTRSGVAVCSFRLAVEGDIKDRNTGERKPEFFTIVTWRNTAELASKYLYKGRMVIVDGKLHTKDFSDREGRKKSTVEVHADTFYFVDSKKEDGGQNQQQNHATPPNYQYQNKPVDTGIDDEIADDELPF